MSFILFLLLVSQWIGLLVGVGKFCRCWFVDSVSSIVDIWSDNCNNFGDKTLLLAYLDSFWDPESPLTVTVPPDGQSKTRNNLHNMMKSINSPPTGVAEKLKNHRRKGPKKTKQAEAICSEGRSRTKVRPLLLPARDDPVTSGPGSSGQLYFLANLVCKLVRVIK